MEYDVYNESVFFGLYRNWNLEPCLKTGGIVIFGIEKPGNLITVLNNDDRIRVHVNDTIYTGVEDIQEYVKKYDEKTILKFKEFEWRTGYRFTIDTKDRIRQISGSEAVWFLDNRIKVEEFRI